MTKSLRTLLGGLGLLAILSSCENDDRVLRDWTRQLRLREEATNIESSISQEGKLRACIKAPLMIKEAGDTVQMIFPQTLHCDFHNKCQIIDQKFITNEKYFLNSIGNFCFIVF